MAIARTKRHKFCHHGGIEGIVNDLQARRISAAENLLRQDLSAIKSIEATIEIIDVEMGKNPIVFDGRQNTPLKGA